MKKFILVCAVIFMVSVGVRAGISTTTVMNVLDDMGYMYDNVSTAVGATSDTTTISGCQTTIKDEISGSGNFDIQLDLSGQVSSADVRTSTDSISNYIWGDIAENLQYHISLRTETTSYSTIDEMLTHYNLKISSNTKNLLETTGINISKTNIKP